MDLKLQLCTISFTDLLYNMVPTVNSTVLFTLKYVKRIDFMLHVCTKKQTLQKNTRTFLKVMDMFLTIIVVMVSWMHACVHPHQNVYVVYIFHV